MARAHVRQRKNPLVGGMIRVEEACSKLHAGFAGEATIGTFVEPLFNIGHKNLSPHVGIVTGVVSSAKRVGEVGGTVTWWNQWAGHAKFFKGGGFEFSNICRNIASAKAVPCLIEQCGLSEFGGCKSLTEGLEAASASASSAGIGSPVTWWRA